MRSPCARRWSRSSISQRRKTCPSRCPGRDDACPNGSSDAIARVACSGGRRDRSIYEWMFLCPASPLKRLAAIMIGLVWTAVGGTWTYFNATRARDYSSRDDTDPRLGVLILMGGIGLVGSGLRPSRSAHIE